MLKKRFSTTLLALVVAVAIPGSVFAADVASESTGEVSAPTSVSELASSTNEADNGGSADADTNGSSDADTNGSSDADTNGSADADASAAAGADVVDSAQQEGDSDQDADVVLPKEDSEGEQTPDAIEPDPEDDGDEIAAPEVTEPEIEDGTGVVDGEEDVVVETPATEEPVAPTEVTEPEAETGDETGAIEEEQDVPFETPVVEEEPIEEMIEGETPIVEPEVIPEEELVTEAAIIIEGETPVVEPEVIAEEPIIEEVLVEEPVIANVEIIHRLYYGDQGEYDDYVETIDSLYVGDELDLAIRILEVENIKCVSSCDGIVLSEENKILLEYRLIEE